MQCLSLFVNVDAEIPHDEGNPETPDYQFVKWMTRNKVCFYWYSHSESFKHIQKLKIVVQ